MEIGVIGLGRMGRIVADRLLADGHDVVAYDVDPDTVAEAAEDGVTPAESIPDLAQQLSAPKRIWLVVPSGDPVDAALEELEPYVDGDDIVVDGGN
ncbi:MAG: NAD(P)-binding domain-containing protein, partial [Halapricum sp.]